MKAIITDAVQREVDISGNCPKCNADFLSAEVHLLIHMIRTDVEAGLVSSKEGELLDYDLMDFEDQGELKSSTAYVCGKCRHVLARGALTDEGPQGKAVHRNLPTEDLGQLHLLMMEKFGLRASELEEHLPDDFLERLGLVEGPGDENEGRSPYTVKGVREMLTYWRVPCKSECKGWQTLSRTWQGKTAVWAAVCEACVYAKHDCVFPELTDVDIAQLPEVWKAVVEVRASLRKADWVEEADEEPDEEGDEPQKEEEPKPTEPREPYSVEKVQQMLDDRKDRCSPGCRGWDLFGGKRGLEIQTCDECRTSNALDLDDDDVAELPEAKIALDQAIAKAQAEIDAARKNSGGK